MYNHHWSNNICVTEYLLNKRFVHKVCIRAKWLIRPKLSRFHYHDPTSSISTPPPLNGMLVHLRATPSITFAGTYLYTWVKDTVRVKALAQEHNTMFPTRAQARNACSGVEQVNHEATALKRKTRQAWSMDVYSFFSRSSTDSDVLEESKVDCSFLLVDANWGWLLATSYSR